MKTVLFYRDFRRLSGGHLSVRRYFNHVRSSSDYRAQIWFSEDSVWDETNPWGELRHEALTARPGHWPDILFLAGLDWTVLTDRERQNPPMPILNRIAHVRHAEPDDERYRFLTCPAIRVCCSEDVRSAILSTGTVNGPAIAIPNAVDLTLVPQPSPPRERPVDVLVAAFKQPRLGRELAEKLQQPNRKVELLTTLLPRHEYLEFVNRARVGVFLPHASEGFYNPPLEGMALETLVVCPEVAAARTYCRDGHNCLRPSFGKDALVEAVETMLTLSDFERSRLRANGLETVAEHSLEKERAAFLNVLGRVSELWNEVRL